MGKNNQYFLIISHFNLNNYIMKIKVLLMISLLFLTTTSYAQTNYTLNGNLGVGASPTHKLSVAGDSKMEGELTVTEKTTIEGEFKLTGLQSNLTGFRKILFVDTFGVVSRMSDGVFNEFVNNIYSLECSETFEPYWSHSPHVMSLGAYCDARVGIGTNTPAAQLGIYNSIETNVNNNTIGLNINGDFDDYLTIGSTANPKMKITNSGNMIFQPITNSTAYVFQVKKWGSDESMFTLSPNGVLNSKGTLTLQSTSNTSNSTPKLVINDSEGATVFKVFADGHTYSTELNVLLKSSFPDYVFEKDYKLMSIYELEQYINKNKKLPKLPTAEKVNEDGLDLGEMNRLLVEKIEELTLYIIQLKREIDEVKSN